MGVCVSVVIWSIEEKTKPDWASSLAKLLLLLVTVLNQRYDRDIIKLKITAVTLIAYYIKIKCVGKKKN